MLPSNFHSQMDHFALYLERYLFKCHYNKGKTMALMTVDEVAEFLGVQGIRVERLARENLLVSAEQDEQGKPLFKQEDVERYKILAERLGGL
jgi:coenzyme F420-reducing hydrogenase delta subunit